MSTVGEHFWQYGVQCDYPGCKAAIWRIGTSEQLAFTKAQEDAKAYGWRVAADRIYGMGGEDADPHGLAARVLSRDYCGVHRHVAAVAVNGL